METEFGVLLALAIAALSAIGALRRRSEGDDRSATAGERTEAAGKRAFDRAVDDAVDGLRAAANGTLTTGATLGVGGVRLVTPIATSAFNLTTRTAAIAAGLIVDGAQTILDVATGPVRSTPTQVEVTTLEITPAAPPAAPKANRRKGVAATVTDPIAEPVSSKPRKPPVKKPQAATPKPRPRDRA